MQSPVHRRSQNPHPKIDLEFLSKMVLDWTPPGFVPPMTCSSVEIPPRELSPDAPAHKDVFPPPPSLLRHSDRLPPPHGVGAPPCLIGQISPLALAP
uniref:Uncharacterized protein n=1 Tax=Arundo donax TaxID=35708 RepID=A0A0A9HKU4_ARUDO